MRSLPCPNPLCTNVFAAADVQKAGAVKCPQCGQEFRLRSSSAPANTGKSPNRKPAAPSAVKPKVAPVAKPAAPRPPVAPVATPPVAAPPAPYGYPPPTPPGPVMYAPPMMPPPVAPPAAPPGKSASIVKVRGLKSARSRHPLLKFVVVTIVVGIFLTAVYYAIQTWEPRLQFDRPGGTTSGPGYVFYVRNQRGADERAFSLSLDKEVWTADKDMKNRLKVTTAFKRADENADAWLAIGVQDFGFRKPREGELLNGAIDRLRNLFEDSLQVNAKLEPAKIAGLDAWRCTFKGRLNVVWWGECYLVSHHGFGYWIFVAAPTLENVQTQFAELEEQRALAVTTDRAGWTEQPPEMEMFIALDNAYSVKTPDKLWRANDPKTEDENGVLYLSGHFQSLQAQPNEMAIAKNATLVGVSLDKKPDLREAFKETVAYLEKKKQEESKDYKFAPFKDNPGIDGELADVGRFPGCIGEMRLLRGKDTMRYVALAVFNAGSKTYGLRFECAWEHQEIWRKEFRDVMKSVSPADK